MAGVTKPRVNGVILHDNVAFFFLELNSRKGDSDLDMDSVPNIHKHPDISQQPCKVGYYHYYCHFMAAETTSK